MPASSFLSTDPVSATRMNTLVTEINAADDGIANGTRTITPTVTNLTNAQHNHQSAAGGGKLLINAIDSSGQVANRLPAADGVGGMSWINSSFSGYGSPTTLTISLGIITATKQHHIITSEIGTTDDLDSILGLAVGDVVILQAAAGHTITLKHNTGNIWIFAQADIALSGQTIVMLIKNANGYLTNGYDNDTLRSDTYYMATGTYTGDGAATKAVTGIGFLPRFVTLYRHDANVTFAFKSNQDGANALRDQIIQTNDATRGLYVGDEVISLDSNGFTVGDGTISGANLLNQASIVYTYVAWR